MTIDGVGSRSSSPVVEKPLVFVRVSKKVSIEEKKHTYNSRPHGWNEKEREEKKEHTSHQI